MQVFAGDLPSLAVERIAIAITCRLPHDTHVAVLFQPAELSVLGNIAPDQVSAYAIPGRPLGPEAARVEPLNRRVANLVFREPRVDDNKVRVGVAARRCVGPVLTPGRGGGDGRRGHREKRPPPQSTASG